MGGNSYSIPTHCGHVGIGLQAPDLYFSGEAGNIGFCLCMYVRFPFLNAGSGINLKHGWAKANRCTDWIWPLGHPPLTSNLGQLATL